MVSVKTTSTNANEVVTVKCVGLLFVLRVRF